MNKKPVIDPTVFTGDGTNLINPHWLRQNVGKEKRFPEMFDLLMKIKKRQRDGEKSFAGGNIVVEIKLVEMMIADDDFRDQCFKTYV